MCDDIARRIGYLTRNIVQEIGIREIAITTTITTIVIGIMAAVVWYFFNRLDK